MSALEREIIEKFYQLQPAEKQRVRLIIDQAADADIEHADSAKFDYVDWAKTISRLRQQMPKSGDGSQLIDIVATLRDIRAGEDE